MKGERYHWWSWLDQLGSVPVKALNLLNCEAPQGFAGTGCSWSEKERLRCSRDCYSMFYQW